MNRRHARVAVMRLPRLRRLPALVGLALCAAVPAWGAAAPDIDHADAIDASFDRSMLSGAGQNTTDLARFERGDYVPAGSYSVDLFLNDRPAGRHDVRFAAASADASATACTTSALLDRLGLHPADLTPRTAAELDDPAACVDIAQVIPGAQMHFEMSELRLDASVPQAFLGQAARGYVDPKYWESGVTAGLLNYHFNAYHTTGQGQSQTSSFLGLDAGLNLGRWHIRHDSSLGWQSASRAAGASHHWQNIATYAQRDLPALHAQLTVGDAWTSGEIFDSVGLRGVQLATDDRMLPQSLRGYAPTVRGTADSNAKVTVRQNGMVIYQTTVAPGPFVVSDLYATGYGGDLEVSVTEADGRVHTFSVPYASVPQLLRPGVTRFSVAAGQLRDNAMEARPGMLQATVQHGFSNLLTGYAGLAGAPAYAEALLGSALNTRYGAFAMDVTASHARLPGMDTLSGQSVRLSYSKTMAQTGTSLTVAAYRYSTGGFLDLGDAMRARDYARRNLPVFATSGPAYPQTINGVPVSSLLTPAQLAALTGGSVGDYLVQNGVDRARNNFSITLSQQLGSGGGGSLYLSGSTRDYWNRGGSDTQFQLGYNNTLGRMTYNLSASRERDLSGRVDNRYMASLTLPLGDSPHAPILTGGLTHADGGLQEQGTINGTAGVDDRFTYGATATHADDGTFGSTASVTGGYRGSHVQLNASLGAGDGYSQSSLSLAGGVVAHPGGVSFSQPLGDTVAIVSAPGAAGARIGNAAGVRVGDDGYGIIPYLTPYTLNTVSIDPTGLSLDVQLDNTSAQTAPRAGAVVMVNFRTELGRFVLFQVRMADGGTLPFGAEVEDGQGKVIGVVGQAGRIMVRLNDDAGRIHVQWADGGIARSCTLPYRLPPPGKAKAGSIEQVTATCAPPSPPAGLARSAP